jgi:hypothetical protein
MCSHSLGSKLNDRIIYFITLSQSAALVPKILHVLDMPTRPSGLSNKNSDILVI